MIEALEMSKESVQTIVVEDESGSNCAWKFDGSALDCFKANTTVSDIDFEDYKLAYSTCPSRMNVQTGCFSYSIIES